MTEIHQAADSVNNGAAQVAAGANNLSEGTTAQATDVEKPVVSINDIEKQIPENADSCTGANELIT